MDCIRRAAIINWKIRGRPPPRWSLEDCTRRAGIITRDVRYVSSPVEALGAVTAASVYLPGALGLCGNWQGGIFRTENDPFQPPERALYKGIPARPRATVPRRLESWRSYDATHRTSGIFRGVLPCAIPYAGPHCPCIVIYVRVAFSALFLSCSTKHPAQIPCTPHAHATHTPRTPHAHPPRTPRRPLRTPAQPAAHVSRNRRKTDTQQVYF